MGNKFDSLTKYIPKFQGLTGGEWKVDKENDGTREHPIQLPYVAYDDIVLDFMKEMHNFVDLHQEYGLYNYQSILEKNNLSLGSKSLEKVNVENLDAQCILALLIGNVRAERFCDGALLSCIEKGYLLKWLQRLEELEN